MSRIIKFRAWDKNDKRVIYGDGFYFTNTNYVFQQYTGLKDKNGKEIYEGDIVYNSVSHAKVKVEWQEELFKKHWGHEVVGTFTTGWVPFCTGWAGYIGSTHFEVIGNIYENPELLK